MDLQLPIPVKGGHINGEWEKDNGLGGGSLATEYTESTELGAGPPRGGGTGLPTTGHCDS